MISALAALVAGGCIFAFSSSLRRFHWFLAFTIIFEGLCILLRWTMAVRMSSFSLLLYSLYTLMLLLSPFLYYFATRYLFKEDAVRARDFWMLEVVAVFFLVLLAVIPGVPEVDRNTFHGIFAGGRALPDHFSTGVGVMLALDNLGYLFYIIEQLFSLSFCVIALLSYRKVLSSYYSDLSGKSLGLSSVIVSLVVLRFLSLLLVSVMPALPSYPWFAAVQTSVSCLFYAVIAFAGCRITYTAEEISSSLARELSSQKESAADELIASRLDRAVQERFYADPSADLIGLSARLQINSKYVASFIKSRYGETFLSFTNRLRIEYASQLLSSGGMSLTEISESCGYITDSTFYRNFIKIKGVSPSEYKKTL